MTSDVIPDSSSHTQQQQQQQQQSVLCSWYKCVE